MKPKDLVTLEQGRLKLFRYPTWGIGIYLGRGVLVVVLVVLLVQNANVQRKWKVGTSESKPINTVYDIHFQLVIAHQCRNMKVKSCCVQQRAVMTCQHINTASKQYQMFHQMCVI